MWARDLPGECCELCWGFHPDCQSCPNRPAQYDNHYQTLKAEEKGWRCTYDGHTPGLCCGGVGHFARHHEQVDLPDEHITDAPDWWWHLHEEGEEYEAGDSYDYEGQGDRHYDYNYDADASADYSYDVDPSADYDYDADANADYDYDANADQEPDENEDWECEEEDWYDYGEEDNWYGEGIWNN